MEELPTVRRLVLQPDESLIITYPTRLAADAVDRVHAAIADVFGLDSGRVILLDSNPTLTVFKVGP